MRSYAVHSAFVRWGAPIILAGGVLGTVGFRLGVERNVRATFRRVGQRDYETLLEQTAPSVLHVFPGDHPLAGRATPETPCGAGSRGSSCSLPNCTSRSRRWRCGAYPGMQR